MSETILSPLKQAREAEATGDLAAAEAIFHAAHNPQAPDPALLMAWGGLRRRMGQLDSAKQMFNLAGRAGAGAPAAIELAAVLLDQDRADEATPLLNQAVKAGRTMALDYQMGRWEAAHKRYQQAAALFRAVVKADPRHLDARLAHARVLTYMGRAPEAESAFTALLQRAPHHPVALSDLAYLYGAQRRFAAAMALYDRLEDLGYDCTREISQVALGLMHMCDWSQRQALSERLAERMTKPEHCLTELYAFFAEDDNPELHRLAADRFADAIKSFSASRERPAPREVGPDDRRLRVGYLCGDFNQHATSLLLAGVLEAHDREQFEIFAYDYSPEDGTPTRARMRAAFEHFVSLGNEGPAASAARIAADGIDILVDVKGYTERTRSEIMALRPAPVQVNFLGYAGTQSGDWIDYVIADETVLPPEGRQWFTEAAVLMPVSWQPNDRSRPRPAPDTDRAAQGLPETGVVFACFNNPFKISPEIFATWMDILRDEPGSVLWLFEGNQFVSANLRQAATTAGIDPARLVFAKPATLDAHIARHGCADIFLDTLPYNAHTTASDALWAGLPMVTTTGRSWASRVGAGVLRAIGLPELIANSRDEYKALALSLARDPARRAALREQLIAARDTAALFDAPAYARALESAFTTMATRARAGEPPAPFAVAASA